jgi:hypothetical protein
MDHQCEGQPGDARIGHPWRFDDDLEAWVRDDCVECGCAFAAMVTDLGGDWHANMSSPKVYGTPDEAMAAYDKWLLSKGWTLL